MEFQIRRLGPTSQTKVLSSKENQHVWLAGRGSQCEIFTKSRYASRKHFSIIYKERKFFLQDHGSANGTFLNNEKINSMQEYPLNVGNIISVGVPSEFQDVTDCIVYIFELYQDEESCKIVDKPVFNNVNLEAEDEIQICEPCVKIEKHSSYRKDNNRNSKPDIQQTVNPQNPNNNKHMNLVIDQLAGGKSDISYNSNLTSKSIIRTCVGSLESSGGSMKCESAESDNFSFGKFDFTKLKSEKLENTSLSSEDFSSKVYSNSNTMEVDLFSEEGIIEEDRIAYEASTQIDTVETNIPHTSYTMTEELIEISDSDDQDEWPVIIKTEPLLDVTDVSTQHDQDDEFDDDVIFIDTVKPQKSVDAPEIKVEYEDLTETDEKWMMKLFKTKEECVAFIESQKDESDCSISSPEIVKEEAKSNTEDEKWVELVRHCSEEIGQILLAEEVKGDTKQISDKNIHNKEKMETVSEENYVGNEKMVWEKLPIQEMKKNDDLSVHIEEKNINHQYNSCCMDESHVLNPRKKIKLDNHLADDALQYEAIFESERKELQPVVNKIFGKQADLLKKTKLISSSKDFRCKAQGTDHHLTSSSRSKSKKKRKRKTDTRVEFEKEIIRNRRKRKLREISLREALVINDKEKNKSAIKSLAPLKVKITRKNRNEFLCQEILESNNPKSVENKTVVKSTGNVIGKVTSSTENVPDNLKGTVGRELNYRSGYLCDTSKDDNEKNDLCTKAHTLTKENELMSTRQKAGDIMEFESVTVIFNQERKSLKSCLKKCGFAFMKSSKPIVSKKSVRFDNTRSVRHYEIENKFLRKTSNYQTSSKSNVKGAQRYESVLNDIFNWNTLWLEECKVVHKDEVPPIFHPDKLQNVKKKYSSYDDYTKSFLPLLLLDLWHSVSKKWKDYNYLTYRYSAVCTTVDFCKERMNGHLRLLKCESLLPLSNETPVMITEGNLVLVQLSRLPDENDQQVLSQDGKKKLVYRIFGYLKMRTLEPLKLENVHPALVHAYSKVKGEAQLMKLELLIKKNLRYNIKEGNILSITVVDHITSYLRQCRAVCFLYQSPLCKSILSPTLPDMKMSAPLKNENIFFTEPLDETQQDLILKLVESCNTRDSVLMQIEGGAGTGKTHVIIGFIIQLLFTKQWRGNSRPKILYCSHSNTVVDECALKLKNYRRTLSHNLRYKLVRYGNLNTMKQSVRDISSQQLALQNELYAETIRKVHCLDEQIKLQVAELENAKNLSRSEFEEKSALLHRKVKQREMLKKSRPTLRPGQTPSVATENLIIQNADVICTTCISSGTRRMGLVFDAMKFKTEDRKIICIIDQAMQSKEPETIIPLQLGVTHLLLVGDPQQLRPPIGSERAQAMGLNQSLFWRLMSSFEKLKKYSSPVLSLKTQYRMSSSIALFPNKIFYKNSLTNGCSRPPLFNIEEYLLLVDNGTPAATDKDRDLRMQDITANLISALTKIFSRANASHSVAAITCRLDQARSLRTKLKGSDVKVNVDFIDNVQGQEFDIVLFLFDADMNCAFRANVAMTRARCSLFIITSDEKYKENKLLSKLIDEASGRYLLNYINAEMGIGMLNEIITRQNTK